MPFLFSKSDRCSSANPYGTCHITTSPPEVCCNRNDAPQHILLGVRNTETHNTSPLPACRPGLRYLLRWLPTLFLDFFPNTILCGITPFTACWCCCIITLHLPAFWSLVADSVSNLQAGFARCCQTVLGCPSDLEVLRGLELPAVATMLPFH